MSVHEEHRNQEQEERAEERSNQESAHPDDLPPEEPCVPSEDAPCRRGGSLHTQELPEAIDEASSESFPASDPPSFSPSKAA